MAIFIPHHVVRRAVRFSKNVFCICSLFCGWVVLCGGRLFYETTFTDPRVVYCGGREKFYKATWLHEDLWKLLHRPLPWKNGFMRISKSYFVEPTSPPPQLVGDDLWGLLPKPLTILLQGHLEPQIWIVSLVLTFLLNMTDDFSPQDFCNRSIIVLPNAY